MRIAIDFGGTFVKITAFASDRPEPAWVEEIEAFSQSGIKQALTRTAEVIRSHDILQADAIGIATPGIVDSENCRVTLINGKYDDAPEMDFTAWCRTEFGASLVMLNDANAALLGETAFGCAAGFRNAVMVILGTGIGTAAMMDGHMIRGVHNQAGILGGHFIMDPFGRSCLCGAVGCLEAYAGSREIVKQAEADRGHAESSIYDEPAISMKIIAEHWRRGDSYAAQIVNKAIHYYAAAAVNMIHAYDPECVVFSGGLANSADIMAQVKDIALRQAWLPWGQPEFRVAQHPSWSVTYGLLKEMIDHAAH